jgi:hypothetical protein
MTEINLDDVREAYATGTPDYVAMIDGLAEAGVPWAADIVAEAELDGVNAELDDDPLAGVDRGELEAFVAWGRKDPTHVQAQLAQIEEDDSQEGLAHTILELAAGDGQEWAGALLQRSTIEAETVWNDELAGRTFDPEKFSKAWFAASENGESEAAMGYYTTDRLEPDPPKLEQRWADKHEVTGGDDKRHVISAHDDPLDVAFSEWFTAERNRSNGHPDAPPADPEPVADPMVVASLGSLAEEWEGDIADRARVEQHRLELQRRRAATT